MNPTSITLKIQNLGKAACLMIILILGTASLLAHYQVLGVRSGGDTGQYLASARAVAQGQSVEGRRRGFLGYIYFLHGVFSLGGGLHHVVGINCLISLVAACLMFLAGRASFSTPVGLLAALAFICAPDLQRWNFYALPEGVNNSLLTMVMCLTLLARKERRWLMLLVPALAWFCTLRAESSVLALSVITLALTGSKLGAVLGGLVLIVVWLALSPSESAGSFNLARALYRGKIIWNYSNLPAPPEAVLPPHGAGFIGTILHYTASYPVWMAETALSRLFWFWIHARPFYSLGHNLVAVAQSIALVFFSAYWLIKHRLANRAVVPPLALILIQTGIVALTFADWDGRHFVRIMPPLLLLASAGAWELWNRTLGPARQSA
jgi:hypothetical protein